MQIKFKLLHPDAKLPVRAHETDACFDVVATSFTPTADYLEYGLGFATEIPAGWEGKIYARSSISNYCLVLCNSVAVMDAHYRGEWKVRFRQFPPGQIYRVGDRVAQIQFRKLDEYSLVLTDELTDTQRGAGGFGSTGK
jgi:dUTP pyrophosphatase